MRRWRFLGDTPEVFPGVQHADGRTLACEPGDVIDLPDDVEVTHARLVLDDRPLKQPKPERERASVELAEEKNPQ